MRLKLFNHPEEVKFIERPNRFIMITEDKDKRRLRLHCPNPGKLTEFLLPGQKLLIQTAPDKGDRKTDGTVVAVLYKGKTIFLHSAKANDIAGALVLPKLFPGAVIEPEKSIGSSRFDFLITPGKGKPILTEIKACSLCEEGLAMFPDTPSARASRHVEELIELNRSNYHSEILFIISHRDANRFIPNSHTDPLFAKTLHRAAEAGLPIRAVSVDTSITGEVKVVNPQLPVETGEAAELAEANRGVYFLLIRLAEEMVLPIDRIGNPVLEPGWYIYVGSAKANLQQRIARHLRKRKKIHWHVDHLTTRAVKVQAFPIATFRDLECTLAKDIGTLAEALLPGFGCSDCSCPSHLFLFLRNPLHRREILDLLFRYRHREFSE